MKTMRPAPLRLSSGLRCAPVAVILVALFVGCENPFFPPTGPPIASAGLLRSTPKGVLEQLIRSYSTRRIELFDELLEMPSSRDSTGFRFYVAPSFAVEKASLGQQLPAEVIGAEVFANVPQGLYYYWNRDSELRRHQLLFSRAAEIRFAVRPTIHVGEIIYTTRIVAETLFVDADGNSFIFERRDTTGAEIAMEGGTITIWATTAQNQQRLHVFELGKQVFYLVRDVRDPKLWVISRWFDFDRF